MISPASLVSEKAQIGENVSIGPFTVVHDNVILGENVSIGSHCEIGLVNGLCDETPLRIGANANIRSHSVLYSSTTIGEGLVTGHHVTLREKMTVGNGVQVGTLGEIQGHCEIGNYVKMQTGVLIGQACVVKDCVWLFGRVNLTNDPRPPSTTLLGCTIEEFAVVCALTVVLPGVTVGRDSFVGAHSMIRKDIPAEHIFSGDPAKDYGHVSRLRLTDGSKKPAYPWRRHFHRGYPEELVSKWIKEFES